jgi:putative hemolysin
MDSPGNPVSPQAPADWQARELGSPYPVFPELLPPGTMKAGRYQVRFAGSAEDLDALQRLRFEVFNLELGEGLDSAFATGRDHDDLDLSFHHLMILSGAEQDTVGTYRLQTAAMARAGRGFYAEGEFELSGIPADYLDQAIEVGRACVARGHRNGRVLNLLWRGVASYMQRNRKRYLFGCCSLTSQDQALAIATARLLEREGHNHSTLWARPLPGFACVGGRGATGGRDTPRIPPLFQSYLALGAKVISDPAIDRQFGTIDFLVSLDVEELDPHQYRFFFR